MLPIIFDVNTGSIVLVGDGKPVERRLELLEAADADVVVYCSKPSAALIEGAGDRLIRRDPCSDDLKGVALVFGAGLKDAAAADLAGMARDAGVLVNIEDSKPLCDFHVPSSVRRGDLMMTVSTAGRSPGLARRLRRHLESLFGDEWAERLEVIAKLREGWRADGLGLHEVAQKTDAYIDQQGWLS